MITPSQLQDLAKKAVSDDSFRAKARKDPKAALESLGIKVPSGLAVKVYENGPSTIHAVLPEKNGGSVAGLDKNVAKVFEKAWSDPKFKESLLKDPTGAIKSATNANLPKNLKIVIHADSKSEMNLVLPYVPPTSGELSDADLEMVAGGKGNPNKGGCGAAIGGSGAVAQAGASAGGTAGGVVALGGLLSMGISAAVSASK
jgi:hypothetical protein